MHQQALTHRGVLRRALPEAERVLLAVGRDPEGHDHAVLADVHAVEEQRDEVEAVQGRGLPRPPRLFLVPRLTTSAGTGSRLRAYWRVATPTSSCSTTRRFSGSVWARA